MDNSSILVIGGAGFVGSNLIKIILQKHNPKRIIIVDNLLSAELSNIPSDDKVEFIKGSISDDEILDKIKDEYEYIFHLATYHGNQSSIHNPIADHENNTLTSLKLMNHVKHFKNISKLVYSAAGCATAKKTYDSATETDEDAPITLNQDSPYSISKIIGEFYSVYFFKQHGLPTVRARFQNVYGPGEILGAGQWRGTEATIWRNVTPTFIFKALHKDVIPLNNGGDASRDFIFVDDICNGLIACALHGKRGDVYNLSSGIETTIKDLAEKINKLTGNDGNIELLPKRSWDNSGKRFGSTKKAEEEIFFRSQTNIDDGLKMTIQWTKDNMDLIQKSMQKHSKYINAA